MTTIQDIVVKDVEKRISPSKHYAYMIEIQWSDGRTKMIGRQYSEFFDFHMSLLEQFPAEAGQRDPAQRIIPFLPGKSLFHRTTTKDFVLKRMGPISEYCTGIAKMPPHIFESETVLDFFRPTAEDRAITGKGKSASPEMNERSNSANEITGPLILDKYVAIADYKKGNKKELNLKAGEVVEVVEKSENGWWLAANEEGMNGWVPAVYLEPLYEEFSSPAAKERARPGEGEVFQATTDFTASSEDEMSFVIDDVLEVLEKNLEGWWYARKDEDEGWVPATYLQKPTSPVRSLPTNDLRQISADKSKRPPPKRSTVRRTLTKAAVARVKVDFNAKMMKQDSIAEEEDDEEFAGEYTTVWAFDSTIQDGISFGKNETVLVIQKSNAGWWYGRIGNKRGWVPETYLAEKSVEQGPPLSESRRAFPLPPAGGSPKKTLGVNVMSTPNQIFKSPKPARPPAPKTSSAFGQVTNIFGANKALPQKTSPPAKFETRRPLSPLPALPQHRGITPAFWPPSSENKKDLSDYQWYRDVTRQEAEDALLCEGEEGYFIIRPSQRRAKPDKPYSLTLYHQKQNWNFHIRFREDKKYAVGLYKESEAAFENVPDLVEHYMLHPLRIGDEERKVKLVDSPAELYSTC